MKSHPRRARTNPNSPRAWGTSDRNGMINNHQNLVWQWDWAGQTMINKRILVSPDELDKPQRQLGTIVLSPDPVPIMNARVEPYSIDEQDYDVISNYTAVVGDILNCDGSFTVYFPTVVDAKNESILINNIGTGIITVSPISGETVNSTTSYAVTAATTVSISFISDGSSNWIVWRLPQAQLVPPR